MPKNFIGRRGRWKSQSQPGESRPPFEDENVYYYGQFVAMAVAETFEQAQDAASHVHVDLRRQTAHAFG